MLKAVAEAAKKGYNRFLEHSLGSSYELETQLLIAEAVKYGDTDIRTRMLQHVSAEQRMLVSFMNKLNK